MQEFDLSLKILSRVLDDKIAFNEALREEFQTNAAIRPLRPFVAGLVGCELRHHLLFTYLCRDLKDWDEEERRFLYLFMGNAYFFKRIDLEIAEKALSAKLGEEKMELAKPILARKDDPEGIIPSSIDRASSEYLGLRYNTPSWVLKIYQHFGYGATFRTLKKSARPYEATLRVRTSAISMEEVLKTGVFTESDIAPAMVRYTGKEALRKNQLVKDGKLFAEKLGAKLVLDSHRVSEPAEILLYDGNADSSLEKEIIESYGSSIGMNIGVKDTSKKTDVSRMIREAGLHNVNFFSAPDPLSMEAAISHPQDLVICCPDSTNFDLIPTAPDYLLRFDKDGMDRLFEDEKNALEGCAKYVDQGGTLVYLIFTISKKEGHATISNFLRDHSEFQLAEEHQHFPFENHETAYYEAVLVKAPKEAKATPPLMDLSQLASADAPMARAAEAAE